MSSKNINEDKDLYKGYEYFRGEIKKKNDSQPNEKVNVKMEYPAPTYKTAKDQKPGQLDYYIKFYPHKMIAIKKLRLDTGMELSEAKSAIEELFNKFEIKNNIHSDNSRKVERRSEVIEKYQHKYEEQQRKEKAYKTSRRREPVSQQNEGGSGCCLVALFLMIFYAPIRLIGGLTKKYN